MKARSLFLPFFGMQVIVAVGCGDGLCEDCRADQICAKPQGQQLFDVRRWQT
jgi:hypothetical protein